MNSGIVFDIKRYSINDGPGIRTTVFLKGCNLDCAWCHNPESKSTHAQKLYSVDKCMLCGACVENCTINACSLTPEGIITDTETCERCGGCAEICPTTATEMSGKSETVESIINEIEKETIFHDQSEGGVTFSGGEPLLHSNFLIELLDACGERGIHRTVDTTGLAKTETLLAVAQRTDHFLYDLKMMDSKKHKEWTGVGNEKILENLKKLAATGVSINIRIPLIKGVNDDDENIEKCAAFVASLAGEKKQVNILPYHNIAQKKYEKLGQVYEYKDLADPTREEQEKIIAIFENYDLNVIVGG